MESTGLVKIIGIDDLSDLKGRNVLIVEVWYCFVLYCIVCFCCELPYLVGYD